MGQALLSTLARFDPCKSWAMYVCNAAHCHSSCGKDCCDIEFETQAIDIDSDDSQVELEVIGCCTARKASKENARGETPESEGSQSETASVSS